MYLILHDLDQGRALNGSTFRCVKVVVDEIIDMFLQQVQSNLQLPMGRWRNYLQLGVGLQLPAQGCF